MKKFVFIVYKKLHFSVLSVTMLISGSCFSQLFVSSGATLNIQSGGVVTVQGDITSSADITGAGKVQLKGTGNQNINMNGFTIPNLEMDNSANATLTGNARIGTDLLFTNGKILQGNFNVVIAPTATITGAGISKYLVTNGTGSLRKSSLGATSFTFPVGNTTTTYNPVTINNSGTSDEIGVRCLANVLSTGTSGTAFTKEVADASWDISEAVAGGSNLNLTTTWDASDELPGFNRTKGGISYYIPTAGPTQGWDMLNSQTGAAAGTNPYTYTRTGITSLGAFAVGTRPVLSPLLVSPKVFLQGPFNTGTSVMNDGLRTVVVVSGGTTDATHGVIPTTEPYTSLSGFTHSGSGGAETISAGVFGLFNVTNNDAIVDWVFVQVHDGVTGTVVGTRAALLQRDGDVVDTDGTSPLNMAGFAAGNYYVSVRHRNHLGVRSLNNMALAKTTTTPYYFTTAQTQAFPGAVSNNPMAALTPTALFGMWGGDATGNRIVKYTGPGNDENQLLNITLGGNKLGNITVYSISDLNLNGQVKYTGPNNDESILLNTVLMATNY
ncbi:MAG: hypothetical protein IPP48_08915 [Chitinophagaceae bacterium]|nr:hypothetical protein [Chitinophagaceae bacterium]